MSLFKSPKAFNPDTSDKDLQKVKEETNESPAESNELDVVPTREMQQMTSSARDSRRGVTLQKEDTQSEQISPEGSEMAKQDDILDNISEQV